MAKIKYDVNEIEIGELNQINTKHPPELHIQNGRVKLIQDTKPLKQKDWLTINSTLAKIEEIQ